MVIFTMLTLMMCYTEFVPNAETRYYLGYV